MFDSWGELLIIAVVALVVVGPKELPQLLRTLGQWVGKARRMAGEFQSQVNEAIREAELDDVKKSVDDLRSLSPKNLIASQLASVTSDLAKVESDVAAASVPAPAEPVMAAAEAERLIDAAGSEIDVPMPLTPSEMASPVHSPSETPEPAPMAHAEGETPKKEPSA
jgi:sec-independent protein translocase protein TatB